MQGDGKFTLSGTGEVSGPHPGQPQKAALRLRAAVGSRLQEGSAAQAGGACFSCGILLLEPQIVSCVIDPQCMVDTHTP